MKVKVIALILSFIFVVFSSAWADERVSVNMRHVKGTGDGVDGYEKKYSAVLNTNENGTSTPSLIVYNATVWLTEDHDGDGYYRKASYFFDIDTDGESVNYYTIVYIDENDGYGWFTSDNFKSDMYTLENGYSPEEGLYYDFWFTSDYSSTNWDIKVELYYEDGTLANTFGPDDDSDLSQNLVEGAGSDVKKDPFIPSSTPSPTPTPAPTVDEIKLDSFELENRLILRKGKSIKISAEALSGGEAISDAEIEAEADNGVVTVSPSVATTDENGLAEFTITARKKGNAKISFTSGDAKKKILRVKVK